MKEGVFHLQRAYLDPSQAIVLVAPGLHDVGLSVEAGHCPSVKRQEATTTWPAHSNRIHYIALHDLVSGWTRL